MEKLEQKQEGKYFLRGIEITPTLIYGPILYTYRQIIDNTEIPIDQLVKQVKSQTGIDLEKIANSFNSGGITIIPEPTDNPGKKIRHEFICFFNSKPKSCN